MWRDLRIEQEEAQTEQTKPQQVASVTEFTLASDSLPGDSDESFTNPPISVFFKSGPPTTSYQNRPGSLFMMHIPKLRFRPLVIGSSGMRLSNLLTGCPGDSHVP